MCPIIEYKITEIKDKDNYNSTLIETEYTNTIKIAQNTGILKITNLLIERNLFIIVEVSNTHATASYDFI